MENYEKMAIYALVDPDTEQVGYVGKSSNPRKRLGQHLIGDANEEKNQWIVSLLDVPRLVILEEFDARTTSSVDREYYWMSYYLDRGHPLTNKILPPNIPKYLTEKIESKDAHQALFNAGYRQGLSDAQGAKAKAVQDAYYKGYAAAEEDGFRNARALGREDIVAVFNARLRGISCYIYEDTLVVSANLETFSVGL